MKLKKTIVTLTLLSMLDAAGTASAQPTSSVATGATVLRLNSDLVAALGQAGISASQLEEALLVRGLFTFPIIEGLIDRADARAEIEHSGGLRLATTNVAVKLMNFTIDTTVVPAVINGAVVVNNELVGRIPLFDVQLPTLTLPLQPNAARTIRIRPVELTLNTQAANALNTAFGVISFQAGQQIGRASITAILGRSSPR
jgi:hypothetical protein